MSELLHVLNIRPRINSRMAVVPLSSPSSTPEPRRRRNLSMNQLDPRPQQGDFLADANRPDEELVSFDFTQSRRLPV
jgi:hypothetical protein